LNKIFALATVLIYFLSVRPA